MKGIVSWLHLCLIKHQGIKCIGGVEVHFHEYLTSILKGGYFQAPAALMAVFI